MRGSTPSSSEKARCVTRYDQVTAEARSFCELMEGFLASLGDTVMADAPLHRLWYDLRAKALFEEAFRADVAEIDKSLEKMILRVMTRLSSLADKPLQLPPGVMYAAIDGLFQQCLMKHLSGDTKAVAVMQAHVRCVVLQMIGLPLPVAPPARASRGRRRPAVVGG